MQCAGYCMQVYRWNVVIAHNFMYYNYIVCTYNYNNVYLCVDISSYYS